MSDPISNNRMDRRDAIKWIAASFATVALLDRKSFGQAAVARRYGADPNLLAGEVTWPLTLNEKQLRAVTALCDVIMPADDTSPSATSLRVPDFIDEWISAPYDNQGYDKGIILPGLAWIDSESQSRFSSDFADLNEKQKTAIADDICYLPNAKPEFVEAAKFFAKIRNLISGGYYTTPEGMKDVGYVGNVPLATFDGPPPEVLRHLGLA